MTTPRELLLEEATYTLANQALTIIEEKYGFSSTNHLGYHDTEHTKQVIDAASTLGNMAVHRDKIDVLDRYLLIIAAAFHDIEQDKGSGNNEVVSALEAKRAMAKNNVFDEREVSLVEDAILATRVTYDAGHLQQSASNYFTQLLADADLVSLGSDTESYWSRAVGLFHEWYGNDCIDTANRITFMSHQVALLKTHVYYTPEANEIFTNQPVNLAFSEDILAALGNLSV